MVLKREIVYGIVQGLSGFWKCGELEDFTVTVDGVHFGCHRLLLAACSDFFRGLFRSGMKETEQKSVRLQDISSETFDFILESMYTGRGVLTNDNVIDIWKASHQLQIQFMMLECENFVIKTLSLENYVEYFNTCKTLNSKDVIESVWSFILKNCNSFFQTNSFLKLSMADVLRIIKCQDLEIRSEDDVIDAIIKWAEYQNNRAHFSEEMADGITNSGTEADNKYKDSGTEADNKYTDLTILLSHARTCLASQRCLEMLVNHPLVRDNKEAHNIAIETFLYQLQAGKRNGHWPSRAVQRSMSDLKHCIVGAHKNGNNVHFSAHSLSAKEWFKLPSLFNVGKMALASVDNALYVLCSGTMDSYPSEGNVRIRDIFPQNQLFLFQLKSGVWSNITALWSIRSVDFRVAVVDHFLYYFSADERTVWKLDSTSYTFTQISSLPGNEPISYLMPYDQSILVFYASTVEGVDETVVQCFDTSKNTWTKLNNLEGPGNGMTNFKDDHFTYLLQLNGDLWKVVKPQSNIIDFEFVVKLWSSDLPLQGAIIFLGDLHIGVNTEQLRNVSQLMRSVPGVFREIIYEKITAYENSLAAPMILNEKLFTKVKCLSML